MATQIGGDTLRHALRINACAAKGHGTNVAAASLENLARQMLRWRWLVIDEISMVSARLLAEVDSRLRMARRGVGTNKQGEHGEQRPFGGLNVIFVGDFWQLDPPEPGG